MTKITYKDGYKYQLCNHYTIKTTIYPKSNITTDFIDLDKNGILTIKKGYAWDGASGIAIDTCNFMRGSLVHDALYQLMRNDLIDRVVYKDVTDKLLKTICQEDGMSGIRSWWVYNAVKYFGNFATTKANKKVELVAPCD